MSDLVVARLGSIEFSVKAGTFSTLSRNTRWRVDKPEPMQGLGVPTSRGRADDTLTIDGTSYPGYSGNLSTVERLREAGDAGEPLLLVDGEGGIFGYWMVEGVTEKKGPFMPTGIERRADWSLTLTSVPDELEVSI